MRPHGLAISLIPAIMTTGWVHFNLLHIAWLNLNLSLLCIVTLEGQKIHSWNAIRQHNQGVFNLEYGLSYEVRLKYTNSLLNTNLLNTRFQALMYVEVSTLVTFKSVGSTKLWTTPVYFFIGKDHCHQKRQYWRPALTFNFFITTNIRIFLAKMDIYVNMSWNRLK